jgi:acyl dehydratase
MCFTAYVPPAFFCGASMIKIPLAELPKHVGEELGVSDWLVISQERVNQFAEATGDDQWIHVDVERAQREIGGTIAHGYLTLSLIPLLARQIVRYEGVGRGLNYGANKVRYTNAVPVGGRIRLKVKLLNAEPRAGGIMITNECTVEVEGQQRPACIAETVAILYPA